MRRIGFATVTVAAFLVELFSGAAGAQEAWRKPGSATARPASDTALFPGDWESSPGAGVVHAAARQEQPTSPAPAAPAPAASNAQSYDQCSNNLWSELGDCCESCCAAGCIAGVEGTFLAPFNEPGQSVALTDLKHDESFSSTAFAGFGGGVRAWLGLHRCGWGYRVTYWHFGDRDICDQPPIPVNGKSAFAKSFMLDADTLDIEFTQSGFCVGNWEIESSFGGRYARLHRTATALGYATLGGVDLTSLAVGTNQLEGAGFTFSIGGKRKLGCDTGWHCFWAYRGSLLWADTEALALTQAGAVSYDPAGTAFSRDSAQACKENESLFINELRLGLQYEHCLQCVPAKAFVRFGMEYQYWNTGAVRASSDSYAFLRGGPPEIGGRADASAEANTGSLNLIGFVIGAGLTY